MSRWNPTEEEVAEYRRERRARHARNRAAYEYDRAERLARENAALRAENARLLALLEPAPEEAP